MKDWEMVFLGQVYSTTMEQTLAALKHFGLVDKKNVLDAGAGYGSITIALARVNDNVVGIERDPERVEIANFLIKKSDQTKWKSHAPTVITMEIEKMGYGLRKDGIMCHGVVMYTKDWKETLRTLSRLLAKKGTMYIDIYLPKYIDWNERSGAKATLIKAPEFEKEIEKNKLKIVRTSMTRGDRVKEYIVEKI